MDREFGPITRRVYSPARVVSAPEAPEAAERLPQRILVDGYNVIFAWAELKELAQGSLDLARSRLIEKLISYQSYTRSEVAVIFDAYRVPGGVGERYDEGPVHVVFTRETQSADSYIQQLVNEIGSNRAVRVVTSDALIRLSALGAGVLRTSSREFEGEVAYVLEQMHEALQRSNQAHGK